MDPLNGGILCQGDHSGQSTLKVHWNLSPPQVRAQCVHFQRGLRRFSNEVWVHWFSPPPFGFPFHLFPFTYFCFPLFFHVVLSSCFVISFLFSFAHTSVLALVCTRTSTYTLTQVSGRPGLDNEVGLVSCPCSLGFSFISTQTPVSRLVLLFMFSLFCPGCACTYATVLALILFASPRGGMCV